jgi:hypothetical protein
VGKYNAKRALLGNLVDYAGTFPPASLTFEKALEEAATLRPSLKHPWLYSKMALPLTLLKTITPKLLVASGGDGSNWLFTALGTPIDDNTGMSEFARAIEWDLRELRRINERGFFGSTRFYVCCYETRLPESILAKPSSIGDFLAPALERIAATGGTIAPYFEVGLGPDWRARIERTAEALSTWQSEQEDPIATPGIKFRTGGKIPPTSEQLASVLAASVSHGLRFKATQGLHHALTQKDGFGFVNVFAALTLLQSLGIDKFPQDEIQRCLTCQDGAKFSFHLDKFAWSGYQIDLDEIESARRRHAGCFGSCSLSEPDVFLAEEFPIVKGV